MTFVAKKLKYRLNSGYVCKAENSWILLKKVDMYEMRSMLTLFSFDFQIRKR